MAETAATLPLTPERPVVAGKFFQRNGALWTMHGLTYGPFSGPDGLPGVDRVAADLALMAAWGANTLRLFKAPPEWFLDLCAEHGLSVLTGVAWTDHTAFLSSAASRKEARQAVAHTAKRLGHRREVAALLTGNELQASLVRWHGLRQVERFLEELIDTAHDEAPGLPVSYANYPTTEYLQPGNADFTAFNVYLEDSAAYARYLARLQNIAGDKPLVISEFGVDAKAAGEDRQAAVLAWQRQRCLEHGVAGNLLFSFTDEWHRGGEDVTGWEFGLTGRRRTPRRAWRELAGGPPAPAALLPSRPPRISVIVCTRNGSRTLPDCLEALVRLEYPDYEIIVVDDGSTEDIAAITARFPAVRYERQEPQGLSVARNTGAQAAAGEILAYTDDDCMADPAWLIRLAHTFTTTDAGAAGGPNIPPAPVNLSQACVIAAPGGPSHVLLTDTTAEHLPGCNLAVRRAVFDRLGGFRPEYHAAGDDVDFCWRLLDAGETIAFNAAAMVWHYRRFTVKAFLRQQQGYGKAEALLTAGHRERFGQLGGARWRGAVYQPALLWLAHHTSRVYAGLFGNAPYQLVYRGPESEAGWLLTGFPWWLLTFAAALNAWWLPGMLWLAGVMAAVPLGYTFRQSLRLPLPARWRGPRARLLLWYLLAVQPVARGWSRFVWNLRLGSRPRGPWWTRSSDPRPRRRLFYKRVTSLELWSEEGLDRHRLLEALQRSLERAGTPVETDDGWRDWDLETSAGRWWRVRFSAVTEYHGGQKCLTRVRIASRGTQAGALVFLLLAAAAGLLIYPAGLHPVWTLGLLFAGCLGFETFHYASVRRAANEVLAAAASAGFAAAGPAAEEDTPQRG